jgi:pyruvate dehydrogenase E2 component (dihydrolipoamide acetyltransferase)
MTRFNLPDLGEGLQEAEIVRWHVAVGDRIEVDQPMVAMETAKAVVEVPAPFAGIVSALHGKPGDTIATGAPLVDFQSDSADGAPESGVAKGGVVGHMPETDEIIASSGAAQHARGTGRRTRVLPAVREVAQKLGVDIEALRGNGAGGLVTLDDVLAAKTAVPYAVNTAMAVNAPSVMRPNVNLTETGELEVLRSLRRAMAQSMAVSRDSVMECTVFDDADIEGWKPGGDYTGRLLRAISEGCRAEPGLNAWFDGASQGRRVFQPIHVGIAVDTPEGLLVPVIRDVGNRDAAQLRAEVNRLKTGARDRSLAPADLKDFTIMLSNFGVMAGRYATPVVVPPAVAILGSGRIVRDVVATERGIEAHRRIPLSLTFDHRCVTGGEAVRFLAAVIKDLEKPA